MTRYSRPGNRGDLIEYTTHTCKDCGFEKENEVVVSDAWSEKKTS